MQVALLGMCFCFFGLAAFANPVTAEKDIEDCRAALASKDKEDFEKASERLMEWRNTPSAAMRFAAIDCLAEGTGEPWVYEVKTGRLVPKSQAAAVLAAAREPEIREAAQREKEVIAQRERREKLEAERQKILVAAEERRRKRRQEVLEAMSDACVQLFYRDRVSAMTNRICVDVFLETGMPNAP